MNNNRYNPYEDEHLHISQPHRSPLPIDDRESFNDVFKHYDIVNGHQIPKKLDHIPPSLRQFYRVTIILSLLSFAIYQIWVILTFFMSL